MDKLSCHISWTNNVMKNVFGKANAIRNPRKYIGNKLWITEVRTSIQVSHLYLRALCEAACQTASECGRQAGREAAFGVPTGIFPSLQGLRPLRRCAAIPS